MRASNETEQFLYDYINIENIKILWEWSENILTVKREETWQLRAVLQLDTSISIEIKLMTNGFIALSYVQCISEKHDRLFKRQQIKLFYNHSH